MRRTVVFLVIAVAVLVLIPYVIAPFYRFIDPVSTPMLWRWATGSRVERVTLPLNRISPALPLAVIVAEDGSFCHNRGIDLGAMREALRQSGERGESRGASTITQQTAKNLFLWQGRSYRPQGARNPAGAVAQSGPAEAADPGNLPQHRRIGPERRVRRRGRRPLGLRQIRPRSQCPRGRRTGLDPAQSGTGAAPGRRASWSAGWPAFMSAVPRSFRGWPPASGAPNGP